MKHLVPKLAPLRLPLLAALTLMLAACNEPAESSETVQPQPMQSAPVTPATGAADKETPDVPETAAETQNNGLSGKEAEKSQTPAVTPSTDAEAAPATTDTSAPIAPTAQPVAEDEVVGSGTSPSTPAPATTPAPDPAAETRTDPVPDEVLQAEHGVSEEALEALEVQPHEIYFPNCAAANAGGYKGVERGEPGYRAELDDDGDGVACE